MAREDHPTTLVAHIHKFAGNQIVRWCEKFRVLREPSLGKGQRNECHADIALLERQQEQFVTNCAQHSEL